MLLRVTVGVKGAEEEEEEEVEDDLAIICEPVSYTHLTLPTTPYV